MNVAGIVDAVQSHIAQLGVFTDIPFHEPKNAPQPGLTCAIWLQSMVPVRSSGLASTSMCLNMMLRFYTPMIQEPQDDIDPAILRAVDAVGAVYTGDFDMNSTIRNIDLLGAYGPGLSVTAGYLNVSNQMYRIVDMTLPLVVNDVWDQVA